MGRLSKAKIDQIQRLRNKGFLQKEVAKTVGVNIKTVRTYDPLHTTPKPGGKPVRELKEHKLSISLLKDIRALADWIAILYLCIMEPNEIPCPHCLFPPSLPPKGKPKRVVLKMLDNGDYKCPECGEILASPPKLARRLLVTEVEEELRREGRLPAKGEAES